ncbi:hypothetical protein AAVH_24462 [Aphelenchoides avenae]|nr:hypothetical protein AAVH_24462 [Aphelenchus avenae]
MSFLAPFRTARETQTSLALEGGEKREELVDLTKSNAEDEQQQDEGAKRMAPPPPSTPAPKKKKLAKVPQSPSLDDAFKETLATITEQMSKPPSETQLFTDHIGAQLEKLSARRQLKTKDAIQRIVSHALDEHYAEQEAAAAAPQWQSQQILPPTQASPSQYNQVHTYYEGLHSVHSSRPASTSSVFSGYASSPSASDQGVLYNGLNCAAQFDS